MNREDLEELTKEELKEKADVMGIKLQAIDSKVTIIDKIMGGGKTPKQKSTPMPPLHGLYDLQTNKKIDGKLYKLTIFGTETDKSPVDIVVNYHNIRVQRDQEVIVSEPYIEALRNSVIHTT